MRLIRQSSSRNSSIRASACRNVSFMPSKTMYSKDRRRCLGADGLTGRLRQKSYCFSTLTMSRMPNARSAGIIRARSSGIGWCRLIARWHSLSSRKRTRPLQSPTLDTVMRRGLHAYPHSAVSACVARNTLSRLSNGSPWPMNTMFVSVSRSGSEYIWFRMSAAGREFIKPCRPVMQKAHFILHPTWHDTHSVARLPSGM